MKIVILGLSITSSWGNGHATTYRGLVRELAARGHEIVFLERDTPWYADNRDLKKAAHAEIALYRSLAELQRRHGRTVREADVVIVGSYVPEGTAIGEWIQRQAQGVTAFYDIDTPVTLAKLRRGDFAYVSRALVARYDLYLSFTGGPTLRVIQDEFGSPRARALFCSVDPQLYFPESKTIRWHLGYLGTYSPDRQPALEELLLRPAAEWREGRFVVAGPQYPATTRWPKNVERIEHLPPRRHRAFYNQQRFTLNITRADMIAAGFSPSVRLFEAAACGTAIITDAWPGLDTFFEPGREVLLARSKADVLRFLHDTPRETAAEIGAAARAKVLAQHTAAHRAEELEGYLYELLGVTPMPQQPNRRAAVPGRKLLPVAPLTRDTGMEKAFA
jgi:spore maturation protein CgeB